MGWDEISDRLVVEKKRNKILIISNDNAIGPESKNSYVFLKNTQGT